MSEPAASRILQRDTHRLISSKYGEGELIGRVSDAADILRDIRDLFLSTKGRLPVGSGSAYGVGPVEADSDHAHSRIINATFAGKHNQGGRFNSSKRGAWYAGFELETSQAEVVWHLSRDLLEIGRLEESVAYDDYLADFGGEFHDIREDSNRGKYLDPHSYAESQAQAESLIEHGSSGIIYPSVRHDGGNCIVCFRPALVGNVRKSARYRCTWSGSVVPSIEVEET